MSLRPIIFSLLFSANALLADGLSRGPYLQMPSPDAITICWQTGEASDSMVHYLDSPLFKIPDLWLMLGDNGYFNAFRFPTKGESGGHPSGTEHYYSFTINKE